MGLFEFTDLNTHNLDLLTTDLHQHQFACPAGLCKDILHIKHHHCMQKPLFNVTVILKKKKKPGIVKHFYGPVYTRFKNAKKETGTNTEQTLTARK